jgi:hypothetical protein
LLLHGALVEEAPGERAGGELEAVLPGRLALRLGVGEHVSLVEGAARGDAAHLAYGSPLVERMVKAATEAPPVTFATLDAPLPRATDPTAVALAKLTGINCVFRPADRDPEEGWAGYLIADYRYAADADERREGLVRVAINEETGADVASLHDVDRHPDLEPGLPGVPLPDDAEVVLRRAGAAARRALADHIGSLSASIQRRHLRDRSRVRAYFAALAREMQAQIERTLRHRPDADVSTRRAKLDALAPACDRKLDALATRYRLRVRLEPVAVLRVGVRVRRVFIRARRRRAERLLTLHQSAATRAFDPLRCDGCSASTHAFALCDAEQHILCPTCDAKRRSPRCCPVCGDRASARRKERSSGC